MKTKNSKILRRRKRNLAKRLKPKSWPEQPRPMLEVQNIHYEMADRTRAIACGGIGAFHTLAERIGLAEAINAKLHLLKAHLPYHESDHVPNIAYHTLTGAKRPSGHCSCPGQTREIHTDGVGWTDNSPPAAPLHSGHYLPRASLWERA